MNQSSTIETNYLKPSLLLHSNLLLLLIIITLLPDLPLTLINPLPNYLQSNLRRTKHSRFWTRLSLSFQLVTISFHPHTHTLSPPPSHPSAPLIHLTVRKT